MKGSNYYSISMDPQYIRSFACGGNKVETRE